MTKEEFEKLFDTYKPEDTIPVWKLQEILVVPDETNPKTEEFLNSRVIDYDFPKDTKQHRQLSAMIRNKIIEHFGYDVTFRELLETGYYPEAMKKESQVGVGCIKLLGDIYKQNEVIDVWKYKK